MDIRITLSRTLRGTLLATVRVRTRDEVIWYRSTLPDHASLEVFQHQLVQQTLAHLERHGGPAAKLVTFQLSLPAGG